MADDDRAVMDRLAALEAEVKAEADAKNARKATALAKLRDQRVTQTAERDALRAQQAKLVTKRSSSTDDPAKLSNRRLRAVLDGQPAESDDDEDEPRARRRAKNSGDKLEDLGDAIELAAKANRVKQELVRTPRKGEKSWVKSGVASLALGPAGWLYAGSMREAVPATVGWVALAALASKFLPVFLMMPVLMVVMPLSAIAGVVYALQYNRSGGRQRLFGDKSDGDKPREKPKQLRDG